MYLCVYVLLTAINAQDVLPKGVNCKSGNIYSERRSRIINGMEVEPHSWNWESCFILLINFINSIKFSSNFYQFIIFLLRGYSTVFEILDRSSEENETSYRTSENPKMKIYPSPQFSRKRPDTFF